MSETGNPKDLETLYNTYFPKVYNYVFYKLLHKESTEDVVSQVFEKVVRNIGRYDPAKASVNTWIFRIADNTLIDFFRRRRQHVSIDDETQYEVVDALAVDFEQQYDQILSPERRALYQALRELPERERTLIYYKYFEHITNREIAARLKMNENTVSSILTRARAKLKSRLSDTAE